MKLCNCHEVFFGYNPHHLNNWWCYANYLWDYKAKKILFVSYFYTAFSYPSPPTNYCITGTAKYVFPIISTLTFPLFCFF